MAVLIYTSFLSYYGGVVIYSLNEDGFAPLDVAVMLGVLPIIKMLLLYGAQESSKCKCTVLQLWHVVTRTYPSE